MKKTYITRHNYPQMNIYRHAALALTVAGGVTNPAPITAAPAAKAPAPAPAPMLAAPEVSPPILGAGGEVIISLPPNFPLSTSRLQVGLFEAGRPARVADIRRDFTVINGRLQTKLNIQASPGAYEIRLVSADKARQPISLGGSLLVTGIQRSPGWWLLDGSPFPTDASSGIPVDLSQTAKPDLTVPFFFSGLKREAVNRKSKTATTSIPALSTNRLAFKTFELPPLTQMTMPGFDLGKLRATLQKQLADAQAAGERGYLGFALPSNDRPENENDAPNEASTKTALVSLKTLLNELQPDAALLLQIDTSRTGSIGLLDIAGPLCDGIVIRSAGNERDHTIWAVKNARRIAEEQPSYDLPIFAALTPMTGFDSPLGRESDSFQLDLWMAGATGLLSSTAKTPDWSRVVERNLPLFVGSVTLEDIGILPGSNPLELYSTLRNAKRIPLLARLTPVAKGSQPSESFAMQLGSRISQDQIDKLRAAATSGARIYLEGSPFLDNNGKEGPWRLGSLVGGVAKLLDTKNSVSATTMTLEDGWMFGTGRGQVVPVKQRVTITLNKETVGGQAKQEKGKDILTAPRVAARLADGTPGLIINPVGKGEVVWMPHEPSLSELGNLNEPKAASDAIKRPARRPDAQALRYYASVADYLQPSLIQVRDTDPRQPGAINTRVALRRSARGSYIVALFNSSDKPANITASLDGAAGVALDLMTETELPLTVQGFSSSVTVTIAPQGYSLIAFSVSRQALDQERNTPLSQAKLK